MSGRQPFTLTPQVAEDAAALARLLSAVYSLESGSRQVLADAEVTRRLQLNVSPELSLLDWFQVRLADQETLTPYQAGILDCSERVLTAFLSHPAFDPRLAATVLARRAAFAAAALPADGWLCNPQHPARQVLAALYELATGWEPEQGAPLESWLDALLAGARGEELAAGIRDWLAGERARLARLDQRLIDGESAQLRARRARQLAARTLNQALADRLVGPEVAARLRSDWLQAMQWVLVTDGEQGPLWQRMKRVTGTLRWTLSPEIGEEARNKLMRMVGQLAEDLETLAPQVMHDESARTGLLACLEAEHLAVLRNLPRETAPFEPVDGLDLLDDGATVLSDTLLAPVLALKPGQWLRFNDADGDRRLRLLLRQDESRQLLLVTTRGARALQTSWEDLALRLARGECEILPAAAPLEAALERMRTELAERHASLQRSRLENLRVAREQAAAETRAREAARQKALAEAQALEAARQVAQQTARPEPGPAAEHLQRARLAATSLTIGTWLEFVADDGSRLRRRLTVVLPSSGKYILVDADGTGRIELARDELIRGLAASRIVPLNRDARLDDALSRVVDTLRHERGPGAR